jgi:hypothetical protein
MSDDPFVTDLAQSPASALMQGVIQLPDIASSPSHHLLTPTFPSGIKPLQTLC